VSSEIGTNRRRERLASLISGCTNLSKLHSEAASCVERAAQASESPLFATLSDSALVAIDAKEYGRGVASGVMVPDRTRMPPTYLLPPEERKLLRSVGHASGAHLSSSTSRAARSPRRQGRAAQRARHRRQRRARFRCRSAWRSARGERSRSRSCCVRQRVSRSVYLVSLSLPGEGRVRAKLPDRASARGRSARHPRAGGCERRARQSARRQVDQRPG
jgi:hypothetical protein